METCRFGGSEGLLIELEDRDDLVVVRSYRRGARHDISPLDRRSRRVVGELVPLFGFPSAGVGVYAAPGSGSSELAPVLDEDPEIQFAGRGLRDAYGAPVIYTENLFVKFANHVPLQDRQGMIRDHDLLIKRNAEYVDGGYLLGAPPGTGRTIFQIAASLLDREDVELCHPELVREVNRREESRQQWHLTAKEIGGRVIDAHANVTPAWEATRGAGATICVIDDGVDVGHEEFASADKIQAAQSLSVPRGDDARPGDGNNHGTACAGVACADGTVGASGVAPEARLMPLRLVSGLGSQDEADAFVWAADHGADVISCSWGPSDGQWWDPQDPTHAQVVPLGDNTRLAIDYAVRTGRSGRGCVITWAAGNGAESVDNDGYASHDTVIAVAACNDLGVQSAYSDHGDAVWCSFPSNDGQPSLTPGIWTTDRSGPDGYNPGSESQGDSAGNYTNSFGGTSSACPGVAGVAALMLSANPDLAWNQVKDIIRRTCQPIDHANGGYAANGHSPRYGFGRVDAAAAVAEALAVTSVPNPLGS